MKRNYLSALALLVMIVFAFGSVDTSNLDTSNLDTGGGTPNESRDSGGDFSFGKTVVTKAHYDQIQNGMSYNQVVAIIGTSGEELSRNKMEGVSGVMESIETVMYMWNNSNGSNMNAMFQNNKLMQKAQFGLK